MSNGSASQPIDSSRTKKSKGISSKRCYVNLKTGVATLKVNMIGFDHFNLDVKVVNYCLGFACERSQKGNFYFTNFNSKI